MAHRPCLLSVHAPSATAGMTLPTFFGMHQQAGQSHLNSDATIATKGAHKGGRAPTRGGCTQQAGQSHLNSDATIAHEGRPQGVGRAPTRGAPTDCLLSAFCPGKGTHKGCPYRLSSLGVLPCEGHPQGAPLPIVFSRRFALRRAPTRGAPTDCRRFALGRAPTRGAPTDCLLSAFCPGKGTHKGCPYPIQAASRGFSNLMQLPRPSRGARWTAGIR